MAKEVPTTLAAKPCQSPNSKKSTRHRLQNEYLSDFPGLLKSVNNNEKVTGKSVVTDHPPLTTLPSTQEEHAIAEPDTLGETTFPISCILKSQNYMGTDGECRFQEFFDDGVDGRVPHQQENPEDECIYERQLKMKINELKLMYGCHPVSDTPFEEQAMSRAPKPSVVIFAHLTEDSLNIIEEIQDKLVKSNPDYGSLRIRREKIHVTFVAT